MSTYNNAENFGSHVVESCSLEYIEDFNRSLSVNHSLITQIFLYLTVAIPGYLVILGLGYIVLSYIIRVLVLIMFLIMGFPDITSTVLAVVYWIFLLLSHFTQSGSNFLTSIASTFFSSQSTINWLGYLKIIGMGTSISLILDKILERSLDYSTLETSYYRLIRKLDQLSLGIEKFILSPLRTLQ